MGRLAYPPTKGLPEGDLRPVQATVLSVGKETADVNAEGIVLRNVRVAKPLTVDQLHTADVVALLWDRAGFPHITAVLGHKDAYHRDPYLDTNPPPAPVDVRVVQGNSGAILKWRWGGGAGSDQERTQLAYYEVDAKLPGGTWGYDMYPVSEGTREYHVPLQSRTLRMRVRAVDLRGNESSWVVAEGAVTDSQAPPEPTGFSITDNIGSVDCTWTGPTLNDADDLAGFFLCVADPKDVVNSGDVGLGATGILTGSVMEKMQLGVAYESAYVFYPGKSLYFNITAFDTAGNESDYGNSWWTLGTARVPTGGSNLLTNADWERMLTDYATHADWWSFSGSPVMGNVGRDGTRGATFTIADEGEAGGVWPYDTTIEIGLDYTLYLVTSDPGQYATCSIFFKTNLSEDLLRARFVADPVTNPPQDGYLTLWVSPRYGTSGSAIDQSSDPVWTSLQYIGENWYRIGMTYVCEGSDFYPKLGFRLRIYNETGGTVVLDFDRPQMEWGAELHEWSPGITPSGGSSAAGLLIDSAGIITSDGTFALGHDGLFRSHLIPGVDNTYDLGSDALSWKDGYFAGTVYADQFSGGTGAPTDAQYLTLALDDDLTNERVFTPGDGIDGTDGGAGSTYTVAVDVTDLLGSGLTESSNDIDLDWGTPTIGTIECDDSQSAGSSTNPARSDHQHAIVCAAPTTNLSDSSTNAEGSASSFARSDHTHAVDGLTDISDAQYVVMALSGDLSAERVLTAGDGLDLTDGGANGNATLAVDVTDLLGSGLTESSNNIALNWGTPTIGTIQCDDSASAGSGTNPARSDHQHAIVCAAPTTNLSDSTTNTEGSASSFARSDHTHAVDGLTDISDAQYVVMALSGDLSAERVLTAGDGLDLTDGGANGNATLAVDVTDFIDTNYGLTESSNNIRVNLAVPSGLEFSAGALQIVDGIAGNGLTISSKVLDVNTGDGLDVSGDAVIVDVTDFVGDGLTESSNDIVLGTPGSVTVSSSNAVTTSSHTHAVTSSSAPSGASLLACTAGMKLTLTDLQLNSLTASTLVYSDASKEIQSLANSGGYLYNNGSGSLSWASGADPTAHNLLSSSHGDTAAHTPSEGDLIVANGSDDWDGLAVSVPASGTLNYLGVNNGETQPSWKSASSNPGAAESLLSTTSEGMLSVVEAHVDTIKGRVSGDVVLAPSGSVLVTSDLEAHSDGTKVMDISSGNVAIGEVATSHANIYYNDSNSRIEFRGGTSGTDVGAYLDTDGTLVANLEVTIDWLSTEPLTAAELTGNVNNYDPGDNTFVRLSSDASNYEISGWAAGTNGKWLIVYNTNNARNIVFLHNSASSTDVNRFFMPDLGDVTLAPYSSLQFIYHGSRWRRIMGPALA